MNIINNSEVLGSLGKDLVLNTLGKVYIRVGDRYYELDFRNNISPTSNNIETESDDINQSKSDVLIVKNTKNLEYPGDGKLIISLDGKFLISYNGKFKDVTPLKNPIKTDSVNISIIEDADVIGQLKSDNLVLDFNSGEIVADSLTVNNLTVNNLNSLSNTNNQIDRYIKGSGKLYIGSEINVLKVDEDDDYIIFHVDLKDVSLFPIGSLVTNQYENFEGEVINVSEDKIKVRILSKVECEECTDIYDTKTLVLKGDYISYDETWGSIYNKKYNIRFGEVVKSGNYSEYELLIVNGDYDIVAKSGILIKCTKDCSISVNIEGIQNTYSLKQGSVYLLSPTRKISITDEIYAFETESDFKNANVPYDSISFIKDTKQVYYRGIIVGGKQDAALPDDFKIDNAVNGAIITKQNGIWQPSYDYATTSYVDTKIRNILGDSSDALDTLKEISNILQDNTNNIGDILSAINDLNKKVEEKADNDRFNSEVERINSEIKRINSLLTINDISKLSSILESKASIESLNNLEKKLSQYITKDYFEYTISNLQFQIPDIPEIPNYDKEIESLKNKDAELHEKIDSIKNNQGNILNSIDSLLNSDIAFDKNIKNILDRITELESDIHDYSNLSIKIGDILYKFENGIIELPENFGGDFDALKARITDVEEDVSYIKETYVDKVSEQIITGFKTFSNGIKIGDAELIWDGSALQISKGIIVKGGGAFGDGSSTGGTGSGGLGRVVLINDSGNEYASDENGIVRIPDYITEKWFDAQKFATQSWVLSKGYVSESVLAPIREDITALKGDVAELKSMWTIKDGKLYTTYSIVVEGGGAFGQGASDSGEVGVGKTILITPSGLRYETNDDGYVPIPEWASQDWVNGNGFATQAWVLNRGFLTENSADLLYAKREELNDINDTLAELVKMWRLEDGKLVTDFSIIVKGGGAFGAGENPDGGTSGGLGFVLLQDERGNKFKSNEEGIVNIPVWATEAWVDGKGYVDAAWVNNKNFLNKDSANLLYATKDEINSINDAIDKLLSMWSIKDGKLYTDYGIVVKKGGAFGEGSESGGGSTGGLGQITIRNQAGQEYKTDANGVVVIPTYLTSTALDGYTTQQWVEGQKYLKSIPAEYITEDELSAKGYALSSDLTKVSNRVTTLEGNFNGTIAKEAAKVSNALTFGNKTYDGSAAQSVLASDLDAVTLSGEQTIIGAKTFSSLITANDGIKIPNTASLKIGDITLIEEGGALKVLGNLVVTGGGGFGAGATTGGGSGGGLSKIIIQTEGGQSYTTNDAGVVTIPNYITSAALNGYATESYVNSRVSAISTTIGTKADKATTLVGYGITDAKITNGAITLGANTIKPLTSHQAIYALTINNSAGAAQVTYIPNSGAASLTLTKTMVGLSNVENTALSTWAGSSKIATLGTITSGTWNGTKIANGYLANSSMTIAGTSVSLGGSISVATLQSNLGLKTLAYKDYLVASDIPDISATYVTVGTSQTISGAKTFSASIAANGGVIIPSTKSLKIGDAELSWNGTALEINKNIIGYGGGAFGSDVRYKDIINYTDIDLATIANAPLFTYKWNDREDKKTYLGTSAQYWLNTAFTNTVNAENPNFYHLDYGTLGVGMGIVIARDVKGVKTDIKGVKTEVEQLRDEVKQLKEKLNKYEQIWHNLEKQWL